MVTICCTARLLKRIGFPAESFITDSTTALGNWYANILFFHHAQVVLFVNENSRLAVITPAKEVKSLANHLTRYLSSLLESLGIPSEWINAEIREMADVHFAKTHNRSVLGTMNDYKDQIESKYHRSGKADPLEMALNLSSCPVGPLQYRQPAEMALDMFKKRYDVA